MLALLLSLPSMARWLAVGAVARPLSQWLHECAHLLAAIALGHSGPGLRIEMHRLDKSPSVVVPGPLSHSHTAIIHHAGWVTSLLLATPLLLATSRHLALRDSGEISLHTMELLVLTVCFLLTACEAICSDLLSKSSPVDGQNYRFFCGNFGLILLQQSQAHRARTFMRRMMRITMVRGAQTAGLITYAGSRASNVKGVRRRVVNGKRSDLSDKLMRRSRPLFRASAIKAPQIFQGHTRFATSSICK